MEWTMYFLCIMVSLFTETQSQIGNQGLCRSDRIPAGIIPSNQRNVISVCTSSSSNTVNSLYFDMGSTPLQATSECYCIFTFQNEKSNSVELELYAGNDQNITVEGFGLTITSASTGRSSSVGIIQTINLKFTVTTSTKSALACFRVEEAPNTNSLFTVRCFPGGVNPNVPSSGNQGSDESGNDSGNGAIIGGVVGGIVLVIVIVVVVVVVVYLRKRKQAANKSGDKEEYDMTENAMYNQPAGPLQRSTRNQPSMNYEVVDAGYQNRGNDVYSEVIKNKEFGNKKKETPDITNKNIDMENQTHGVQSKPEDEYNHLNELPKIHPTGNVYSALGKTTIETNQDHLYNTSSQSDTTNAIQDTGNVYNTTTNGGTT